MGEGLTAGQELEHNEIAARLIVRHIGRMNEAWTEINALHRLHPDAPVGTTWSTFRSISDQMRALIKTFDGEDNA